jgi:hypothetical protein
MMMMDHVSAQPPTLHPVPASQYLKCTLNIRRKQKTNTLYLCAEFLHLAGLAIECKRHDAGDVHVWTIDLL